MKYFTVALLIFFSFFVQAQTIHIPDDYSNIQEGIEAAMPGDTILVAPGTYAEHLHWAGKELVLASHYIIERDTAYISQTIIDGGGAGTPLRMNTLTEASLLCGFTVRNGYMPDGPGGGILLDAAAPRISHMLIIDNYAMEGGGIACFDGWLKLAYCTIASNEAIESGGGIRIQNSHTEINDCGLYGNEALNGGGLFFRANLPEPMVFDLNMRYCILEGNAALASSGGAYIRKTEGETSLEIAIHDCLFSTNSAQSSGALMIRGEEVSYGIYSSRFTGNTAQDYNGAVNLMQGCEGEMINCLLDKNIADLGGNNWSGGGLTLWGGAQLHCLNSTFAHNFASYGAGMVVGPLSEAFVLNSIFWGNVHEQIAVVDFNDMGGILHLDRSAVHDGLDSIRVDPLSQLDWGDHNISGDPSFTGTGDDEYALSNGSPCIDSGTPDTTNLNLLPYDFLHNFRIWDGDNNGSVLIDMGACEYGAAIWVGAEEPAKTGKNGMIQAIYPNPSAGTLIVNYLATEAGRFICTLYSPAGNRIKQFSHQAAKGDNSMYIDLSGHARGIYFIRLDGNDEQDAGRIVINK